MARHTLLTIFFLLSGIIASRSQYTLRLVVTDVATRKLEDIYVSGNFNGWQPHDLSYKLKPFGPSRRAIVLKNLAPGNYEFKFTRGSWDKVETAADGGDIDNRTVEISGDTSVNISIAGWKDDFPLKPKPNTASAQVQLLDSAFFIPQLNRYRRIWVYLPRDYQQLRGKKFPVLYMLDGQNLFNVQTAAFDEWGVDECLDTLEGQTGKDCIVIGIDNGGDKRITEYNPYDNPKYGKGEGKEFVDFIVQTLKPFIEKKFRVNGDEHHTFIAGSSEAALISLYAVMTYPKVFGGAGVFSPAFWLVPQLYTAAASTHFSGHPVIFFYAGGKESESMVGDLDKMYRLLGAKKECNLVELVSPTGEHREAYWRKAFPVFFKSVIPVN